MLRYLTEPDDQGRRVVRCDCGYERHTHWPIEKIHHACAVVAANPRPRAPAFGPGTELEKIFKAAGAKSDLCAGLCGEWRDKMNRWGVSGCREHRGEIIRHIRTAMFKTWVADQMAAGWVSLAI